jgi:hypothetical protein
MVIRDHATLRRSAGLPGEPISSWKGTGSGLRLSGGLLGLMLPNE